MTDMYAVHGELPKSTIDPAGLFKTKSGPIIIVGNGPSLNDISNDFLHKYPSFGANTIHMREGFEPTYYAAADEWVAAGFWDIVSGRFRGIPKFVYDGIPSLMDWEGENVIRWHRKPGPVWLELKDLSAGMLQDPGIAFKGITHAMLQIALWMGYEKFFLVGCDNTSRGDHFYEAKLNEFVVDADLWAWAFDTLQTCMIPYPIINLSTRGNIRCLPRADWTKV